LERQVITYYKGFSALDALPEAGGMAVAQHTDPTLIAQYHIGVMCITESCALRK
jgi:hypothetical protein